MIRVLIADDQQLIRSGLRSLLERDDNIPRDPGSRP